MSPRNELEEWLTELPPLDGGDDESDENEGIADDFVPDEGEDPSLDDAAADDLEVDEGVEITEEEPDSEDDEQWQADVGEPELDFTEGEPTAIDGDAPPDAPADGDGELDIDEDLPSSDDDAGEEGTTDPIEHSLDEDLPALDADDEGDFEDALLLEERIPAASRASVRWADALWQERTALSRKLTWGVEDDDAIVSLCLALASTQEVVAAVTEHDVLLVSRDETKAGAVARVLQAPAGERGPWLLALSGSGQPVLWAASREGELAKSVDLGATWTRCAGLGRPILAIGTRDDGALSVLARKADAVELLTSKDGTKWFAQRISVELHAEDSRSVWLTHRGLCAAIGDAGGVSISRDGRHFVRVPASAGATAGAFAGSSPDAPLILAGAFEGDEALQLMRIPREGDAEIIGEVKPPAIDDDDPKIFALTWHDSTETLRIAFATHLLTWGPARKSTP
jgi:hypothetical protein